MSVIWFMCCFFYVASKDSHLSLALLICVSMVLYSSYCHPTFKEPSLDPNNIKNYCPIFLSSCSVQSIWIGCAEPFHQLQCTWTISSGLCNWDSVAVSGVWLVLMQIQHNKNHYTQHIWTNSHLQKSIFVIVSQWHEDHYLNNANSTVNCIFY